MTVVQNEQKEVLPRTLHGIKIPIFESEVSPLIWKSILNGQYEAKEVRHVREILRPGDRVLELGSGLGVTTSIMAKIPEVQIWSFDANPHMIKLARRIAKANGVNNATITHGLLSGGEPSMHVFYIRRDFWMSSLIESQGPYDTIISVKSSNLDEFISTNSINVLVMDIEGAERDLLITTRLEGIDRVFLELHDHLYGLSGVRNIFTAMEKLGFSYDPRGSSGPCILFIRDDGKLRPYISYD